MTRTCESGLLILKSVSLPSLAELALLAVFLLCALYDLTLYTNTHLSARKIQLTPAQKRLLGVNSTGECALQHCIPSSSSAVLQMIESRLYCNAVLVKDTGV